jgi:hypothetical protein
MMTVKPNFEVAIDNHLPCSWLIHGPRPTDRGLPPATIIQLPYDATLPIGPCRDIFYATSQ